MYAVYNYQAGSTQANVLNDLVKILTGETNKANLSANCVQANTSILSTVPAGWTLHDAAAGTNTQNIKALNQDGTTYKYFSLQMTSTTTMSGAFYESWNAIAHTGTNWAAQYWPTTTWDSAGGGYFYIYATSKNIIIMPWTSTGYKSMQAISLFEFTPDVTPAGYPRAAHITDIQYFGNASNISSSISRFKYSTTTGDGTSGGAICYPVGLTYSWLNNSQLYRDTSEASNLLVYRVGFLNTSNWHFQGSNYDFYITGPNASNLDEIVYSGKTYVCFRGSNSPATFLVPKE